MGLSEAPLASRPAPEAAPTLSVVRGPRRGTVLPLVLAETLVGRLDSNHLAIDDASVSRIHARFVREAHLTSVEDVGSRAGTFVNGRLVVARTALADGDEITIGDVVFVFSDVAPPA